MDCVRCGALLPAKSDICRYCSAKNDTDLKGIRLESNPSMETRRCCPRCDINLESIAISASSRVLIERCSECFGAFFDLGELESLMSDSVGNIFQVDHLRIKKLLEEQAIENDWPVAYLRCPDCDTVLNRENLGARSGIIIDRCRNHGIWLDGGELGRALKWYKAGGRHHCNFIQSEKARMKELYSEPKTLDADEWFLLNSGRANSGRIASSDDGLEVLRRVFSFLSRKV